MQRAAGVGAFEVRAAGPGPSRLGRLMQSGSAKIRFLHTDDQVREAVLINTAGGLAGGDRFAWSADAGPGAGVRVITQACEKVYRSTGPAAEVQVSLTAGAGAVLEWMPQETILFDGARLERRFEVEATPGARLLAAEAVILGRRAMGETRVEVRLHDRWRVRRDGRLIFADDLSLEGGPDARAPAALLCGAGAFASVLLVADDAEARLETLQPLLGPHGGASAFDGQLFCRFLDNDGLSLRRRLTAVISALRDGRRTPRLWTV
jgi:urease accessory protein